MQQSVIKTIYSRSPVFRAAYHLPRPSPTLLTTHIPFRSILNSPEAILLTSLLSTRSIILPNQLQFTNLRAILQLLDFFLIEDFYLKERLRVYIKTSIPCSKESILLAQALIFQLESQSEYYFSRSELTSYLSSMLPTLLKIDYTATHDLLSSMHAKSLSSVLLGAPTHLTKLVELDSMVKYISSYYDCEVIDLLNCKEFKNQTTLKVIHSLEFKTTPNLVQNWSLVKSNPPLYACATSYSKGGNRILFSTRFDYSFTPKVLQFCCFKYQLTCSCHPTRLPKVNSRSYLPNTTDYIYGKEMTGLFCPAKKKAKLVLTLSFNPYIDMVLTYIALKLHKDPNHFSVLEIASLPLRAIQALFDSHYLSGMSQNTKLEIILQAAAYKPATDHDMFKIVDFMHVSPSLLYFTLLDWNMSSLLLSSKAFHRFMQKQLEDKAKGVNETIKFACVEKLMGVIFKSVSHNAENLNSRLRDVLASLSKRTRDLKDETDRDVQEVVDLLDAEMHEAECLEDLLARYKELVEEDGHMYCKDDSSLPTQSSVANSDVGPFLRHQLI